MRRSHGRIMFTMNVHMKAAVYLCLCLCIKSEWARRTFISHILKSSRVIDGQRAHISHRWKTDTNVYILPLFLTSTLSFTNPLSLQYACNLAQYCWPVWGLCCQKQVSQAGISKYIPQWTAGRDYLSLPEIPASGNKVLIYWDCLTGLRCSCLPSHCQHMLIMNAGRWSVCEEAFARAAFWLCSYRCH